MPPTSPNAWGVVEERAAAGVDLLGGQVQLRGPVAQRVVQLVVTGSPDLAPECSGMHWVGSSSPSGSRSSVTRTPVSCRSRGPDPRPSTGETVRLPPRIGSRRPARDGRLSNSGRYSHGSDPSRATSAQVAPPPMSPRSSTGRNPSMRDSGRLGTAHRSSDRERGGHVPARLSARSIPVRAFRADQCVGLRREPAQRDRGRRPEHAYGRSAGRSSRPCPPAAPTGRRRLLEEGSGAWPAGSGPQVSGRSRPGSCGRPGTGGVWPTGCIGVGTMGPLARCPDSRRRPCDSRRDGERSVGGRG
jgi:hypothetical protein